VLGGSHGEELAVQAEDVFRSANEKVVAKARELEVHSPIPFLCECSDTRCFRHIPLTLEEYDSTGASPQRYLVVPGHAVGGASVVAQDGRFALAEKS
jgi:hypothetical protein